MWRVLVLAVSLAVVLGGCCQPDPCRADRERAERLEAAHAKPQPHQR